MRHTTYNFAVRTIKAGAAHGLSMLILGLIFYLRLAADIIYNDTDHSSAVAGLGATSGSSTMIEFTICKLLKA